MKKTLAAVAVLGAFAGSALAADVTLYGRIDEGLLFTHTRGANDTMEVYSGNRGSNRFGIDAKEKINENLSVRVYLENGFKSDTGKFSTSNTIFDRRAILALETNYGEFAFGRMGSVQSSAAPFTMGLIKFDPFGTSYSDASVTTIFANSSRNNNSVTYRSPKIAGFQFGTTYSFGATDDTEETELVGYRDRTFALVGNYSNQYLFLTLMYSQKNFSNATEAIGGNGYEDARTYGLGGTLNITDTTKLFAGVQYQSDWRTGANMSAENADEEAYSAGIDGWSYLLGITQTFGPHKLLASAQYFDGELSDDSSKDAKRSVFAAAYEYSFSKTLTGYVAATYSNVGGHFGDQNEDLNREMFMLGLDKRF